MTQPAPSRLVTEAALATALNGAVSGATTGLVNADTGRAVVAQRHARRAHAQITAVLSDALPGASVGAPTDAPTITPRTGIDSAHYDTGVLRPEFRYNGANVVRGGTSYPGNQQVKAVGLNSTFSGLGYTAEFIYTGQTFETRVQFINGYVTVHRVWADGILIGTTAPATGTPDGSERIYRWTFPDARTRNIRIDLNGGAYFAGLHIEQGQTIAYPTARKSPRCIILGDSFTEGAGTTAPFQGFASFLALHMGWIDTWASGSGSTGYLATGGNGYDPPRVKFRDRVHSDVIAQNADIVIVAGGINDSSFTPTQVGAEAGLLFDTIRTGLPLAEVIVIGPWSSHTGYWTGNPDHTNAIRAQAESRGFYFIDPVAEQWITGTGHVGATVGEGNADTFISSDGTHPTNAGHAYIAERLVGHLRMLGAAGA